ncbi:hypothetical protein IMG5_116040 [Ichthyophthirius multifiliis]|uniref:Peptidase M20 dimerisation domain-containing protein n=1 Tax=Ichthyophthirius multifiliis TaxID=5932 RepID=G0QUA6_ICHMU|nr:hypothetical protein IMG5_116040 [Ichthyophthirius multifiliis]EGR31178.1 hypothetical protein IMG5_116040 [Ichthyophthirius multifiliis]|eukprot:XP_004034664.1 hypothetical protein IMG5_116040 [Ichthyophthirius multifiliis]
MSVFDKQKIIDFVENEFNNNALPALQDYIRIPNLSPSFDQQWQENGLLFKAANHLKQWVEKQNLKNTLVEIIQDKGKPPLIFIEVAPTDTSGKTALFYGHYDKQPHFTGWSEGLGPTNPVIKDDFLYGRGASDDGYSIFGSILAIKACQVLGYGHPKCLVTIEGEEESGSYHYMTYLNNLSDRIGTPDFVFCLDSGCCNYDNMWITTSLRGVIEANLTVQVLNEGVHSGDASGIVPCSFRILRQVLERLENSQTGRVIDLFQVDIPPHRYEEAYKVAQEMDKNIINKFPYHGGMLPTSQNQFEAYLNRTWRSQLTITGADGLPQTSLAGNVLRPSTTIKLSMRIPPTLDYKKAAQDLKQLLESNPPYNALISVDNIDPAGGWSSPLVWDCLQKSMNQSSINYFGRPIQSQGEGGSIPLMNELQEKWKNLQFIVTGVLGPKSNAHGPNEMLNLNYTKKLICCMTQILSDVSVSFSKNN